MDVIEGLRRIGLSEYEARAYATLIAHPGITGYEVAKLSGIPRAKVYEVLAALGAKDIVGVSQQGGRDRHHPIAPEDLLQRHLRQARLLVGQLGPQLDRLATGQTIAPLITVRSYDRVLARAHDVVAAGARRVFVAGWPAEMNALKPSLEAAEQRGLLVFALVYGSAALSLTRLIEHPPLGGGDRAAAAPWLVVVADHNEALIAEPAPGDEAVGLWTRNRAIATVAAEYIKHDIYLVEEWALLEQRGISLDCEMAHLQAMWFDDLSAGSGR